jgi:hypothetical protein
MASSDGLNRRWMSDGRPPKGASGEVELIRRTFLLKKDGIVWLQAFSRDKKCVLYKDARTGRAAEVRKVVTKGCM